MTSRAYRCVWHLCPISLQGTNPDVPCPQVTSPAGCAGIWLRPQAIPAVGAGGWVQTVVVGATDLLVIRSWERRGCFGAQIPLEMAGRNWR